MKDWYFYQERGKTVGPLSLTDLKTRVREGRLRLFDLIYQDGDTGWKMALENPVLRPEFKSVSNDTLRSRPWVVLQKKTSVAMDYITSGPFSEREVRESILAGRIAYSDYIWKQGYPQWQRIANLEEFNPRAKSQSQVGIEPPPATDEELLKSVVMQQRKRVEAEEIPEEAVTATMLATVTMKTEPKKSRAIPVKVLPNLTKNIYPDKTVVPGSAPAPAPATESESESAAAPVAAPAAEAVVGAKKRGLPWGDFGIAAAGLGFAVLLVFGVIRWWSHSTAPPETPQVAKVPSPDTPEIDPAQISNFTQPVVDADPADSDPTGPEPQTNPTLDPQAPKVEPTELVLNVATPNGTQARIEIRSNGSKDYPVYVQIIGLPGQVSDGAAFYRFMKLVPSGRADQPLDLSDVILPTGKFILRAETGTIKKEARFQLAAGDSQHKAAVNRMRKLHAQAFWSERLFLFRLSQQLEAQVAAASKNRKGLGKGMEVLGTIKRPNASGKVLFDDWWELKQILAEARISPTQAVVDRARKERERLAQFSVWK